MSIANRRRPKDTWMRAAETQRRNGNFSAHRMAEKGRKGLIALGKKSGPTSLERAVMGVLVSMDEHFISQHPIDRYVVDFYLPHRNLVIEADGEYFHRLPRTIEIDARKNAVIRDLGFRLVRLPESDIKRDVVACVREAVGQ
jgi:very-short-patch-repair endonuclease